MMDVQDNIRRIIDENYAAAFSFCEGDAPYQVWMHYVRTGPNQIAVISAKSKNHSKMALKNPNVSFAILPQQNPGKLPRGLAVQGTMTLVAPTDKKIEELYEQYTAVHGKKQAWYDAATSDDPDTVNFWIVDVSKYVLVDYHSYPDDPRKELVV